MKKKNEIEPEIVMTVEELEREIARVRYALVIARIAYADTTGAEQVGHKADIVRIQREERRLCDRLQTAQQRRAWRIVRNMGTGASRSPSKKNS